MSLFYGQSSEKDPFPGFPANSRLVIIESPSSWFLFLEAEFEQPPARDWGADTHVAAGTGAGHCPFPGNFRAVLGGDTRLKVDVDLTPGTNRCSKGGGTRRSTGCKISRSGQTWRARPGWTCWVVVAARDVRIFNGSCGEFLMRPDELLGERVLSSRRRISNRVCDSPRIQYSSITLAWRNQLPIPFRDSKNLQEALAWNASKLKITV